MRTDDQTTVFRVTVPLGLEASAELCESDDENLDLVQ